jgi:cytochrome c-type biogenesis protein CcmE
MNPRLTFLAGGMLVFGTAGWLMYSSIANTGVYYLTPHELAAKVASDTTFHETGVKMGARVVPGSVERAPGGKDVKFRVTDGVQVYTVAYTGLIPDTFSDSADVVVDGRLDRAGTFHATTLLAKCGARFESATPDAHKRAAAKVRPT